MVDRYWTKEGSKASANVSTSWNTQPDGTGTDALPVAGDTVHFGHPDTLAVNKGTAPCSFDLALNLFAMETYSGYNSSTITSDTIQFVSNNIIQNASNDWLNAGFLVGMEIVVTGASNAANNGTFAIASITGNLLTITATTLVTEAAGASVTVASDIYVDLAANITLNKLTLNTKLSKSTAGQATITFSGAYLDRESYVFNGDNAVIIDQAKINYSFNSSANGTLAMRFDDGPYPLVTTAGTTFLSPEYMVPTSTNYEGLVTMYSLQVLTGAQFAMGTPTQTAKLNATRTFVVSNTSLFSIAGVLFDAGFSTFAFSVDVDNWVVPVTGDTTYGTAPFFCRFYNLIISTPSTAGFKALIPDTRTLSVNSLTVEGDAILRGQTTTSTNTTSTICSVRRPVIEGSWNFSQLSDGIYVSLMPDTFPITPSYGPAGRVQLSNDGGTFTSDAKFTWTSATSTLLVDGKLTVTGLIDPTGVVFTPQATNPETTNPLDTIWINSETGHLMRGDRDTESTVHYNVRNDSGVTIPIGTPLYSKGEIGGSDRIKVGIADASDPATMPAIGIAMEEMDTNSTKDGNMILTGVLNENITITGVTERDIIYVAPHGGTAPYLTITRPSAATHLVQNIGVCVRQASANTLQGMYVSAIGRTNDTPNCSYVTTLDDSASHPQSRRLVGGTNITLTDGGGGGDLVIDATGGGGSGTVTSVAVSGSDGLQVDSGSPITTSGTIALGVDKTALLSHINVDDGADVTGTANVTAAGALMDSEVVNLADVKAFDPADYATAGQGATADAALPKAGGTMTGEIEATTITLNAVPADPATDNKVRIGESGGTGEDGNNMFMIRTNDGYLMMGPNNSTWAHFQTDRAQFYFSKPITYNGNKIYAYSGGMQLGTGSTAAGGTTAITVAHGSTDITVAGTTTSTGFIKTGGAPTEFLMADGSVTTGSVVTGEYEKYYLDGTIGTVANGVTTQITFAGVGSSFIPLYNTPVTAWTVAGINTLDILQSGLYQFTFSAFLAALGGSVADYRITISSNPSLTGDLLSFRNRTYIVDRYHGSGASTVYLTAGQQVFFSVLNNGANYQVGGYIGAVGAGELRTFLDVRRLE